MLAVSRFFLFLCTAFRVAAGKKNRVACLCCVGDDKQFYLQKMVDLIKVAEEAFATGKEFPAFRPGDTITVAYKNRRG